MPPGTETAEHAAEEHEGHEGEADTKGGFREPHPEEPSAHESDAPEPMTEGAPEARQEPAQEFTPPPQPQPPARQERHERHDRRDRPERQERHDRPPEHRQEPARPKQWVRPADFRPADASAIHQAVLHATEIAESLKHTINQLDEILELVELAERQTLADEREIEELRRALRRIQPPRHSMPPPQQQSSRGPRRDEPRREEHYRGQPQQRHAEPPPPREEGHGQPEPEPPGDQREP